MRETIKLKLIFTVKICIDKSKYQMFAKKTKNVKYFIS